MQIDMGFIKIRAENLQNRTFWNESTTTWNGKTMRWAEKGTGWDKEDAAACLIFLSIPLSKSQLSYFAFSEWGKDTWFVRSQLIKPGWTHDPS